MTCTRCGRKEYRMKLPSKRRKILNNPTVEAMRSGLLSFKRRLDIPMWHVDHLNKTITLLEEAVAELKRIRNSNTLRNVDKVTYAQYCIVYLNGSFKKVTPKDPRERGASKIRYDGRVYSHDANGFDALLEREDLQEPAVRPRGQVLD